MKEFIEKLIGRLEYLKKDKYVLAPTVCYVLDGVERYINELAEEYKGGWIACGERLPEESREYLTFVEYDDNKFIAIDEFSTEGILAGWNCTPNYRVIAWMPLPAPYKENENGKI